MYHIAPASERTRAGRSSGEAPCFMAPRDALYLGFPPGHAHHHQYQTSRQLAAWAAKGAPAKACKLMQALVLGSFGPSLECWRRTDRRLFIISKAYRRPQKQIIQPFERVESRIGRRRRRRRSRLS